MEELLFFFSITEEKIIPNFFINDLLFTGILQVTDFTGYGIYGSLCSVCPF